MCEGRARYVILAFCLAVLPLAGCRTKTGPAADSGSIKVVRVHSPSDDRSGAEHCAPSGSPCRPLAPGQEIPKSGFVRTFAGSTVTLDLGQGRRLDLGPLSETKLAPSSAELTRGDIGLSGTPLIQKESTFDFVVGRRTIRLDALRSTLAQLSVSNDGAELTLRQGQLLGTDVDGLRAGQSLRLTSAGAFHTSASGGELSPVPYVGTRRSDFAELWPEAPKTASRGLGTMTARVPNTERVLDGVRLLKHQVEVTIVDGLARTEVIEEFENQTDQILEGRFRFPVPGDAAVSRLGLWVGDELVEGEVVEAQRARAIYESIVDRPVPRDPALLEWVTAGEMSLKVFPILPKKTRRVLLGYDQLLTVEGGRFRYSYPLSLGEGRENAISELSIAVHVMDTQGEIGGLRVPSHDAKVGREGAWRSAYYSQRDVTAGTDFVLIGERRGPAGASVAADMPGWTELPPPALRSASASSTRARPATREGHFVLRASVDMPSSAVRPKPVVADRAIVLDVSYSQSQATIRAQAALALAIVSELEPEEAFVLLACDSACAVHPSPTGPPEARLDWARRMLAGLAPGGASDLAGALVAGTVELGRLALGRLAQGPSAKGRQLILLSDGQASAGELSAASIARVASQHLTPSQIDLRLVGVGRKLDHDRLENLAIELDAAVDYLQTAVDLEERIFEIAIGLRQAVVRSASIDLPAGFVLAHGTRLPALRLGQEVVLTGELRELTPGQVAISGRLDGLDYQIAAPLVLAAAGATRNPFVAALFARKRIQMLLLLEDNPERNAEIVRLSTTHRAMSPYTSFLVLENDDMFRRFGVERLSGDQKPTDPFPFFAPSEQPMSMVDDGAAQEEERSEGKGELASPLPTTASAKAAASPRPAPAPKKASSSGGAADESRDRGLGESSGRTDYDVLRDEPPSDKPMPEKRKIWHMPRAHLSYSAAGDAWRSWDAVELEKVRLALERTPESRSRMEEFVRRHLAQGRFAEAAQVARRFLELDPDYLVAQDLVSQAAVVSGDHELARRMLDVQVETRPESARLHSQAARAFDSAGDGVRACAHVRSLSELSPADADMSERARRCWSSLLGGPAMAALAPTKPESPQLRVLVTCEPGTPIADCPSPLLVAPDGRVTSPWTPGDAECTASSVGLQKVRTGSYFVLLLGGAPGARGRLSLEGRHERTSIAFVAGGLRTVAQADVRFY